MSKDSQTLTAQVQVLRAQIAPYTPQNPRFQAVDRQLQLLETTLQEGLLALQWVTAQPAQFKDILAVLERSPLRTTVGRVAVAAEPQGCRLDEAIFRPQLRLQYLDQETEFFSLQSDQKYVLGRVNDCSIVLPDECIFVSGNHATLLYDREAASWLIQDTSRNGTFLNGERLAVHEWRSLAAGDRILLGDADGTQGSASLIFDHPFEKTAPADVAESWRDFDLVCFLLDFNEPVTPEQKQHLNAFSALISKSDIYALIDIKNVHLSGADVTSKSIKDFKQLIKSETGLANTNLGHVFSDFLMQPNEENIKLNQDFGVFFQKLQKRLEQRKEVFLSNRLAPMVKHLQKIGDVLLQHEKKIGLEAVKTHTSPIDLAQVRQLFLDIKAASQKISTQKKATFEWAHASLDSAEKQLFDDLYADSFPCKLQVFAQEIKPSVSKVKHKKLLQLRYTLYPSGSSPADGQSAKDTEPSVQTITANVAMLQFCQIELHQWAHNLWLNLYENRNGPSLKTLHQEVFDALAAVPSVDIENLRLKLSNRHLVVDVDAIFKSNFTQISDKIVIKEPSAIAYLLKKFRSQWMQFIFIFSLFSILGIAGRRQIMRYLMAPVINAFQTFPLVASAVLMLLIFLGVRFGMKVYQDEQNEGREKQANELRSKLCKHYQTLAQKHLARPFLMAVKQELLAEEQRIEGIQKFLESQRDRARAEEDPSVPPQQSHGHRPAAYSRHRKTAVSDRP